jgi:hypothetical protein
MISTTLRTPYVARSSTSGVCREPSLGLLLLSLWPLVAGSGVLLVLKIASHRLLSGPVIIPDKDAL